MDHYSYEPNSLLNYRVKCLEKDMRALKRRYEYMVRALMQRVIPKEEWDEWIAEYMGDMED